MKTGTKAYVAFLGDGRSYVTTDRTHAIKYALTGGGQFCELGTSFIPETVTRRDGQVERCDYRDAVKADQAAMRAQTQNAAPTYTKEEVDRLVREAVAKQGGRGAPATPADAGSSGLSQGDLDRLVAEKVAEAINRTVPPPPVQPSVPTPPQPPTGGVGGGPGQ